MNERSEEIMKIMNAMSALVKVVLFVIDQKEFIKRKKSRKRKSMKG